MPCPFLLDAQDIRRALDAGQQIFAVVGIEEFAERLDAANDHQQIVLAFEREHGIDEIVPRALLAQLDFQTIGEEGQQVLPSLHLRQSYVANRKQRRRMLLSTTSRITPNAARRSA